MDASTLLLCTIGLFFAGIVKGTTGLGYATCSLPILVMAVGLQPAMAIVIGPTMATNLTVALATGHLAETVVRFRWLYVAMLPGIVSGVAILSSVDQFRLVKLLGFTIFAYGLYALSRPGLALSGRWQTHLQIPTGFANGVLTGLTGAQVVPLFPYIMALQLSPDRTVQAINLAVLISTTVLAIGLITAGIMSADLLVLSVLACAPALLGVHIGSTARRLLPDAAFRRVALVTLMLMGTIMMLR